MQGRSKRLALQYAQAVFRQLSLLQRLRSVSDYISQLSSRQVQMHMCTPAAKCMVVSPSEVAENLDITEIALRDEERTYMVSVRRH